MNLQELTAYPLDILGRHLVTLENGTRPSGGVGQITDGIPSLGGEHLTPIGGFTFENVRYVPHSFFERMERGVIRTGDVLLVKDGATTGKVAYVRQDFPYSKAAINEHLYRLCPNEGIISSEYLFWFLYSEWGQVQIQRSFQGAAIGGINQNFVDRTQIPLPPLSEQERIVAILRQADDLRRLRARANQRAQDLLPALFYEMFGEPGLNPFGWNQKQVDTLGNDARPVIKTGPFGSALKRAEYVDSGIPVWGIDNVQENSFIEEGSLFITSEKYAQLQDYDVQPGDVLISRAGTTGRMCVARPEQTPSIIGTNLIRVSLDESQIIPEYFSSLFSFFAGSIPSLRATGDSESYSFINSRALRSVSIPVPPLSLQEMFQNTVLSVQALFDYFEESSQEIDRLFQSLVARAFTGELTAAWRESHWEKLAQDAAQRDALLGARAVTSGAESTAEAVQLPLSAQPRRAIHDRLDASLQNLLAAITDLPAYFRPQELVEPGGLSPVQTEAGLGVLAALGFVRQVQIEGRHLWRLVDAVGESAEKPAELMA